MSSVGEDDKGWMGIFSTVLKEKNSTAKEPMTLSRVSRGLFIRFPFSVYKNVHLTEEDTVNICNNIFFNQAKKEKKGGFGEQVNI